MIYDDFVEKPIIWWNENIVCRYPYRGSIILLFCLTYASAGYYPANILEKVAAKELCSTAKRRLHSTPGMGMTGRAQETEGKGRKNKKRMGKKNESQDEGRH